MLSKVIRWGLKSDADHTATVVWRDGQPKILEAKGGEKSYLKCFYAWIRERENQTFWLSPVKTTPDIEKRIADCIGRKYDYGAVLVWMVIFQGTGIWFGPTNLKALDRMFCHEMSAYIRGKKEWWCLNRPNNLGDFK